MQIHELTKRTVTEASIADRIKSAASAVKTGVQSIPGKIAQSDIVQQNIKPVAQTLQQGDAWNPVAYASNKQAATQAQAAKYAQILQKQGYGTAATAPAPTPATQTPAQPVSLGGQTLDPNNPAYANLIAKAQATQQPAATATTPAQPTSPATPAAAAAAPQAAGAVNTNRLQAGAVATGGAPAVMLAGDFNAALSGLKLNTNHIKELKDKIAQDASFANAFLKALGLKK
jgi:hypothetical protein